MPTGVRHVRGVGKVRLGLDSKQPLLLGTLIYGATLSVADPLRQALEDERAEGRAIVRVHILDPAALVTSLQALFVFWPYGDVEAGHVTH